MRGGVAQPDSDRLVQLLPTCPPVHLLVTRWLCAPSFAGGAAPADAPTGPRTMPTRSPTMAERLLRRSWAVHDVRGPSIGAPIPMWKQLTGEPVAGKPPTGFGGRRRRSPFPTPILWPLWKAFHNGQLRTFGSESEFSRLQTVERPLKADRQDELWGLDSEPTSLTPPFDQE